MKKLFNHLLILFLKVCIFYFRTFKNKNIWRSICIIGISKYSVYVILNDLTPNLKYEKICDEHVWIAYNRKLETIQFIKLN